MPDNMVGELRRSSVIMTYSPGAVADMRAESGAPVSGVTAGLDDWDRYAPLQDNLKYQKIIERRLCKKLAKKYFRLPPVLEKEAKKRDGSLDESSLVLSRFPKWLQCPTCEIIRPAKFWAKDPGRAYRFCAQCSDRLPGSKKVFAVPVRFVTACENGHLDEFPWNWWVQHKSECKNIDKLKLTSEGPGLAGLHVICPECGSKRSLDGSFAKKALEGLKCNGNRPWIGGKWEECNCKGADGNYRVLQRGASNLYYPVIESALDIPPWTHRLEAELGDYWDSLLEIPLLEDRIKFIKILPNLANLAAHLNLSPEQLAETFEKMQQDLDTTDVNNLKPDEYRVFTSGIDETDQEFETSNQIVPAEIRSVVSQVVRVARLREVRVARGFTRIKPPFDPDGPEVAKLSKVPKEWLPAIEVRGEGIFLKLDIDKVEEWENKLGGQPRIKSLAKSWELEWNSRYPGKPLPFAVTPRLLMIHSFSHAIIHQLTLECGYSSASLRERLYADNGMAGVLIYTATPDSDGTLGGLQRRAMPDLLGPTVIGAIKAMEWCSSDPLCISGEIAAPESHSVASCHSCLMLPETSCELHNRFLDRALLIGYGSDSLPGFCSLLLREEE